MARQFEVLHSALQSIGHVDPSRPTRERDAAVQRYLTVLRKANPVEFFYPAHTCK